MSMQDRSFGAGRRNGKELPSSARERSAFACGFELIAGLEVHCQLATRSKLFCGCSAAAFGSRPNSAVCPVCTGQPGVLPVLNQGAVELAFRAALALGCRLPGSSVFARKNYFYPDLPKAYQISQYEQPFALEGGLEFPFEGSSRRVRLHRIHMEEDAGKLLHEVGDRSLDHSLVDFNRCGVPLIEIVTEPDIRSGDEALAFLSALKEVLVYSGVSACDMEKGELRCDANISIRKKGETGLGTKVELKNLNSFRFVKEALEFEFERQVRLVTEENGRIQQETRLWDADKSASRSMRSKEEAHDYRYFPEPDLPPLAAEPALVERLRASLPELPAARRGRYVRGFGLSDYDAEVLASQRALGDYFEAAVKDLPRGALKTAVNIITTDLLGRIHAEDRVLEDCPVSAAHVGRLAALIQDQTLSVRLAKDVFSKMWESRRGPDELVSELGLSQVSDEGQVRSWVKEALSAQPKAVEDIKAGKERAIGAIVGAVMKLSKGKANPALVNRLIKEEVRL